MIKKQIVISRELEKKIEKLAEENDKSFSEVVLAALKNYADQFSFKSKKSKKNKEAMIGLIGLYESGISDGSINHDKELYEK